MRSGRVVILLGVCLLCFGMGEARAATAGGGNGNGKAVEVVRPRGLLLMGPIDQSVGLRYEYFGRDSEDYSSSTHRFREKYSLGTVAAVWDPDLLVLNLRIDFWLEQQQDNYQSGGARDSDSSFMSYDFAASAFERSHHPIIIRSSQEETDVSNSFSPSYTLTTARNSLTAKYFSKLANLRFHYQHLASDSAGRDRDTSRTSDLALFTLVNNYRDVSFTQVDLSWNKEQQDVDGGVSSDTDLTLLTVANTLALDKQRRYSLASTLQSQDGTVPGGSQQALDITETLRAELGKALTGIAIYNYRYEKFPGVEGVEQETTENAVDLSLTHMLYRSLQTRLEWHASDTQLETGGAPGLGGGGGSERETRGGLWFQYTKKLPMESLLTVNAGGSREQNERDYDVSKLSRKQLAFDLHRGDVVNLNIVEGTLAPEVRMIDAASGQVIDLLDYDVDYITGRVTILSPPDPYFPFDDGVTPGIDVEIVYQLSVSRAPYEYTTDTTSVSGSLGLLEGRYRISARYFNEDQTLESGEVATGSLPDLTETEVRFDARHDRHRFGLEYGTYESGNNKYRYLDAEWFYDRVFSRGTLQLQARNRLVMYQPSGANRSDYDVNTLTLGTSYTRRLNSWASLLLSLSYANYSGDNVSRDAVFSRATLQGRVNRLIFNLHGTSTLRMEEKTFRDDYVSFEITRLF